MWVCDSFETHKKEAELVTKSFLVLDIVQGTVNLVFAHMTKEIYLKSTSGGFLEFVMLDMNLGIPI